MKVVTVLLKYAYGKQELGYSLNYRGVFPAIEKITDEVVPFWMDDYLKDRDLLHQDLMKFVEKENPDAIFFLLMKDEVSLETLDQLKRNYITIHWFGDDTWRFECFARQLAPHFTYAVTTDKFSLEKYKEIGCDNVIMSQWAAYDVIQNFEVESVDYKYDITFVGASSGYRKWIVQKLAKAGFQVECFGNGWPNGIVSFEEMEEIFHTSRINLNISNSVSYDIRCLTGSIKSLREFVGSKVKKGKKTAEQIKARNFEIPAFGGFQLTNYVPGIEDYFHIGQDISVYSGIDDLILQAKYFLKNESLRREIALKGYRSVVGRHTYVQRFQDVFEVIGRRT